MAVLNRPFRERSPQPAAVLTYDAQRPGSGPDAANVASVAQGALIHFHTAQVSTCLSTELMTGSFVRL